MTKSLPHLHIHFPRILSDDGQRPSRVSESRTQLSELLQDSSTSLTDAGRHAGKGGRQHTRKNNVSETTPSKWCPCSSIHLCLDFSKSLETKSEQTTRDCKLLIPWVQYSQIPEAFLDECCAIEATETHNLNIKIENSSSNTQSY